MTKIELVGFVSTIQLYQQHKAVNINMVIFLTEFWNHWSISSIKLATSQVVHCSLASLHQETPIQAAVVGGLICSPENLSTYHLSLIVIVVQWLIILDLDALQEFEDPRSQAMQNWPAK